MKVLKPLILVTALTLGGCATTVSGNVNATIDAVINATKIACQFQPTISTVAALLNVGGAITLTAETLAKAICDAVAPAVVSRQLRARLSGPVRSPIVINGVEIHGRFVSL